MNDKDLKKQDTTENKKEMFRDYMQRMRANKIVLGADLVETREVIGKPVIDKETGHPKVDEHGEIIKWASKYYAKFTFMGGEIESEINEVKFSELSQNIGMSYFLEGRLAKVKSFGTEIVSPVFSKFELLI